MRDFAQSFRSSLLYWHLKNFPALASYAVHRPTLSVKEEMLAAALDRDGIAVANISELLSEAWFVSLRNYAAARLESPEIKADLAGRAQASGSAQKNSFLVELWPGPHVLEPAYPFHQLSLSPAVLNIVDAYLGLFAKFREFFLQITVPVPPGTAPFASQRWHADPDDRKMVKVFLYLNDVDETAGPFTYIRGSHHGGKWRDLFPYHSKKGRHPDPEVISREIPKEGIMVMTGKAGTLIFCDTSGIHRGGYATKNQRIMYTSVYTTPASNLPTRYEYPAAFRPEELSSRAARRAAWGRF